MFEFKLKNRVLTLIGSTLPILIADNALAQITNIQEEGLDNDEVVTTGTRLASGVPSEPTTIITAEDIELRGITSVDQLLRQVTNNNTSISSSNAGGINGPSPTNRGNAVENLSGGTVVDLRGLGAGSTLVLVNGRRIAGEGSANGDFADISGIPIEAIESVEIISSGASAIYGSDAVAGVVNIKLKKDYTGGSIRLRSENSSSGGDSYSINGTYGFGWNSGNLTLTGSYTDEDAVSARRFGVTTLDFRSRGGSDRRSFSSTRGLFSLPSFLAGEADPNDPFATSVFVLPENSAGINDFTNPDTFDVVLRDTSDSAGLLEEDLPISFRPGSETIAISARLTQDVDLGVLDSIFVDGFYSSRKTDTQVRTPRLEIDGLTLSEGFFGIPFFDDFSFSGFREDVDFTINLADSVEAGIIPNLNFNTDAENLSLTIGGNFEFSENWTAEINGGYIENTDTEFSTDLQIFDVYFGIEDEETFEPIQDPFNLVRNDFITNTNAADALRRTVELRQISGKSELWTAQAIGRGKLLSNRNAGAMEIAYGAEYREENISTDITIISPDFDTSVIEVPDLGAKRTTSALFAEASFPIISNLTINGAARFEDVENKGQTVSLEDSLADLNATGIGQLDPIDNLTDFEQSDRALTWRAGVAWDATNNLLLRATTGKSFRAPNAFEVGEPAIADFLFEDFIVDDAGDLLDPDTPFLSGGNRLLESETAQTYNFGFVFSPTIADHAFSVDFDYFIINYKDRITTSGTVFNDALNGNPLREEAITRNADGSVRNIFISPINIAEQDIEGFDIKFTHSAELGLFNMDNTFSISRQEKNDLRQTNEDAIENRLGISQPMTRWNISSSWNYNDFDVTAFLNFTGKYDLPNGNEIDSFTTTDLSASYSFPQKNGLANGLKISVGASNIFDVDPPFRDADNGFITQFYDVRRQVLHLDVRKTF